MTPLAFSLNVSTVKCKVIILVIFIHCSSDFYLKRITNLNPRLVIAIRF